ncbi:MAG: 30S ribosomal protein S5 [bacterium]
MERDFIERPIEDFDKRVVSVRRVAKVRAGSKRLRFSALVIAGNKKGKLGIGLGRGQDTRSAIEKGFKYAKSHSVRVEITGDTIPHEVVNKFRAAKLILKPAGPGTGLIASSSVRAVLELAGLKNVLSKQLGASNEVTNAYCAFESLKLLRRDRVLQRRARITRDTKKSNTSKLSKDEAKRNTTKKK